MKRSKKLDDRTVKFVLKRPTSFFDEMLSDIVYIIPVGYNPKKPVSTGPWKFVSFKPGQQTVLVPFANYWGHKPAVDQLRDRRAPGRLGARQRAALGAGRRDQPGAVRAGPGPEGQRQSRRPSSRRPPPGTRSRMRVDMAPFNDVRVRQAIRLVMDRKQAVETALFGQGVPASDYYGRFDPSARHQPPAHAQHRAGEGAAEGRRKAEPQGRARHVADLCGHRRGLPGARPEREGSRQK